jgi:hypothetical protein
MVRAMAKLQSARADRPGESKFCAAHQRRRHRQAPQSTGQQQGIARIAARIAAQAHLDALGAATSTT